MRVGNVALCGYENTSQQRLVLGLFFCKTGNPNFFHLAAGSVLLS